MPLSEDEQRILQDIERSFYENDPAFAKVVSRPAFHKHAARNCRLAVAGFVVGIVVLLSTFTSVPVAAFAGFILMVASTGFFFQNMRYLGTPGRRETDGPGRSNQVNSSLNEAREQLRKRFGKP